MTWISSSVLYLSPPAPGEPDAWTQASKGHGGQKLLSVEITSASEEVAKALQLPVDAAVVRRSRLILLDDQPVEVVTSHWPGSWAAGTALAEFKPIKGGAVRLLADLGWVAATSIEDAGAEAADGVSVPVVAPGTVLFAIRRTLLTSADIPFEFTVMHSWDGHRQRYVLKAG